MKEIAQNKFIQRVADKMGPMVYDKVTSLIGEVTGYNHMRHTASVICPDISDKEIHNVPIIYNDIKLTYNIGDKVVLMFLNDNIMAPVIVGKIDVNYIYNEKNKMKMHYIDII